MNSAIPDDDSNAAKARKQRRSRPSLVEIVREDLRGEILSGAVPVGERLPSEARLTKRFGVSRTVIREAISSLRGDGLVEPRQGAGVFVLTQTPQTTLPFWSLDPERISHTIELLELRSAVEIEAAGLAATRHSPAQEEDILQHHLTIDALIAAGKPTSEADLGFHLCIADATNNPRFREFLELMGQGVIPRAALQREGNERSPEAYLAQILSEHRVIAEAIADSDELAAREAMRTHLKDSQKRYRELLRQVCA